LRYYQISEPVLRELLMAAHMYRALEGGGVDNWEWAGASVADYIQECSIIDFVHYEEMEEIVEADIVNYPVCTCQGNKSTFEVFLESLPKHENKF
jgi:hypothetical protein